MGVPCPEYRLSELTTTPSILRLSGKSLVVSPLQVCAQKPRSGSPGRASRSSPVETSSAAPKVRTLKMPSKIFRNFQISRAKSHENRVKGCGRVSGFVCGRGRSPNGDLANSISISRACKIIGATERQISRAIQILNSGNEEIRVKVEDGKMTLTAGADEISRLAKGTILSIRAGWYDTKGP